MEERRKEKNMVSVSCLEIRKVAATYAAVTEVFIDIIYSLEIKIKNGQSDMV